MVDGLWRGGSSGGTASSCNRVDTAPVGRVRAHPGFDLFMHRVPRVSTWLGQRWLCPPLQLLNQAGLQQANGNLQRNNYPSSTPLNQL